MGIEPVCFSRPLEVGEIALLAGSPETGAVGGGVGLASAAVAALAMELEINDIGHHFGPIMSSGLTIRSKSSAAMPSLIASSRRVEPFLWAILAIFAARS